MYLTLVNTYDNSTMVTVSTNKEVSFTLNAATSVYVYVAVDSAAGNISNLTIYPMIRSASIIDDTYVPYAMTNYELTGYIKPWICYSYLNELSLDSTSSISMSIPSTYTDVLIDIGIKNSIQNYGGCTLLLPYKNMRYSMPKTIPLYKPDEPVYLGIVQIYIEKNGNLIVKNINIEKTLQFDVFVR